MPLIVCEEDFIDIECIECNFNLFYPLIDYDYSNVIEHIKYLHYHCRLLHQIEKAFEAGEASCRAIISLVAHEQVLLRLF